MNALSKEGIGSIPPELATAISGLALPGHVLSQATGELIPRRSHELDLAIQTTEIFNIRRTADRIEELLQEKGVALPSVYALHTAGFGLPFDSKTLGRYVETAPFELLPPTDIQGHEGSLAIANIDHRHTYLAFLGREHPYEGWLNRPYGQVIAARKLRVVKELARRQRERGENPIIITTYLSGVAVGNPLKPGNIGIIISDTELGPSTRPGTGSHGIFDLWLGDRFQAKWGRSSNIQLARAFLELAQKKNIPMGPVALVGTFDAPAFEDPMDAGIALAGFEKARKIGLDALARSIQPKRDVASWAREIFRWPQHYPSLVWGMGVSAELAVLREVITRENPNNAQEKVREDDFPVLALTLITDTVGGKESVGTTHPENVARAFATEPRNTLLLRDFVEAIVSGKVALPDYFPPTLPEWATPFSLQMAMWYHAEQQNNKAEEKILAGIDEGLPQTINDLKERLRRRITLENRLADIYQTWLYPDEAALHRQEAVRYRVLLESLTTTNDGRAAYNHYVEMRNIHLNAASGRLKKIEYLHLAPPESRKILNAELQEKRRQWHLKMARVFEQSARLVASEKGLEHKQLDI